MIVCSVFNAAILPASIANRPHSPILPFRGHVDPHERIEGTYHGVTALFATCLVANEESVIHHLPHLPQFVRVHDNVVSRDCAVTVIRPRRSSPVKMGYEGTMADEAAVPAAMPM